MPEQIIIQAKQDRGINKREDSEDMMKILLFLLCFGSREILIESSDVSSGELLQCLLVGL